MNKELVISLDQFNNILAFISLFVEDDRIMLYDPDYIIEKYERYIGGDIQKINNDKSYLKGMHPVLKEKIFDKYHEKWQTTLDRRNKIKILKDLY